MIALLGKHNTLKDSPPQPIQLSIEDKTIEANVTDNRQNITVSKPALRADTAPHETQTGQVTVKDWTAIKLSPTPITKNMRAMVVSAHSEATNAGIKILEQGGSAIDAAIAVQATLGLVEPQSSGLGGGAFLLTYDSKTGEIWNYDGRETAPSNIHPEMFLDENKKPLRFLEAITSGLSTGVPGVTDMLHLAHQDYGKLEWGDIHFKHAKDLAENGFAISPRMSNSIVRAGKYALTRQKAARDYFFKKDGKTAHPVDHILKNQDYAKTLTALATNPRALYEGWVAKAIIETINENPRPGYLTLQDLKSYKARKVAPLCSDYREHMVCGPRPPSSGGVATQAILGLIEPYNMPAIGPTVEGWHLFIEASRLAYADRDKYVGDPNFVNVPTEAMLNKAYLAERTELIFPDQAMTNVQAGKPIPLSRGQDETGEVPGTSHFTIIDKDGLVVSMTTTVESAFGSQRMAAGFMLNNQLTDFSFRTHDKNGEPLANAPTPNKRPRSSMAPSIVFAPNGEFLFTTGSPGGSNIIAYTAKTMIAMIDWSMRPDAAIHLPNVIGRGERVKMEAKGLNDEKTNLPIRTGAAAEFGMPPEIISKLEKIGHDVVRSRGEISGIHIIYRMEDGTLIGAADKRREGTVKVTRPTKP